jgi:hypothetical protein
MEQHMAMSLKNILQNVKDITMSSSSLETVLDMERVLDQMHVYAFKNWKRGELVKGPIVEKYFVSCVFMWPYRMMPDPRGARRLVELNCEVKYKKSRLEFPIKVKNYDDFKPGTKVPRLGSIPIWLVSITMPKNLIRDIGRKAVEYEGDVIDLEDIEEAYEQDFDQDQFKTQDGQNNEPA